MINFEKISRNRPILSIILAIIIFIIVYLMHWFFYWFDKKIQGMVLDYKNQKLSNQIIVLEIDEKTLSNLGRFPFSRDIYANLIENLESWWVSTIGFDIVFADKTKNDKKLAEILKKYNNIILWTAVLNNNIIEKPLNEFEKNVYWYWYFRPNIDKITKTVYSFKPQDLLRTNLGGIYWNKVFNHFTVEILKNYYENLYLKKFDVHTDKNYFYLWDKIKFPFEKANSKNLFINFLPSREFKKYSFYDIYDRKTFKEINKNQVFKNKIVLIWATAKGLKDIFFTSNWMDYWIYVHANILNTFLTKNYYVYFPIKLEWLLIFLIIILGSYFNLSKNSKVLLLSNLAIIILFFSYFTFVSLFTNFILNNPFSLILALIFSLTWVNFIKYLIADKNKSKLVKALSEYISEDIANKILGTIWEFKLEWENKKISIFFSDIAGFTTISEKFDAEKLVKFLREYLGDMSNIIMDKNGFINKYEWDAIMALFWVFWYEKTSTYDNCDAALIQQFRLNILNETWQEKYGQKLEVRMWIHTWEAIIWNIWAKWRKMEFTALWDSVNLASRLEWVNKFYWTFICVSEASYNEVKDNFDFRYLDKIRVKWKNKAINIYELIWYKNKTEKYKLEIKKEFEEWLEFYFKQDFNKAWKIFKKLSNKWDRPSSVFSRRCLQFEISPPAEDWDWVWTMKEK